MASSYNSLANPNHFLQPTCYIKKSSLVDVPYYIKKYLLSTCFVQGTVLDVGAIEDQDNNEFAF